MNCGLGGLINARAPLLLAGGMATPWRDRELLLLLSLNHGRCFMLA